MKLDIDFSKHPAFSAHVRPGNSNSFDFVKLMSEVDGITDEIYRAGGPFATLEERYSSFYQRMQPLRHAFDQGLDSDKAIDATLSPFLKKRWRTAMKELAIEREGMLERLSPAYEASRQARADAEEIAAEGFKMWQIPDRWLTPLSDFIKETLDGLRARIDTGATELLHGDPGALPQAVLKDFCEKQGVLDAISALHGRRYTKVGFTLHVSHPNDRWHHTFDDLGLPVSRTAQMHYDLGYDTPKAMVYMNDVSTEQGAFSMVPSSAHWEDLGIWLSYRKQTSLALMDYLKEINAPPLGTNNSIFLRPEVRKAFASIPEQIRNTCHPGDLILDDTPLSGELLKLEKSMPGPKGSLALFAGSHMLHRGGLATKGERWALQACFWPENSVKMPKKEDIKTVAAKGSAPVPKKSFFGRWFGGASPAPQDKKKLSEPPSKASSPAPAPAATAASAAPAAGVPENTYSDKRFRVGMKQIMGEGCRLSIVDVGGAVNLQPHWHRFQQIADYTIFEPHLQSYQALVQRQQGEKYYRSFCYINEALAGTPGPRTLYLTNAPTGSSLLPLKKGGIMNFPHNTYIYPIREEAVTTTTLEDSLQRAGVGVVHGIKLDTQGTEIEILRGLGSSLSAGLLFVEMELAVIEHYDAPSSCLEEAIPYLRSLGLQLFDLRTNRFHGNAMRMEGGVKAVTDMLGCHPSSASVAQRLNEVDAIFFRDPRTLIDQGTDPATLQRLIASLCAYYFFSEAIFAATYAAETGLIEGAARDGLVHAIQTLHQEACLEVADLDQWLAARQYQNWGQYMRVPYPSA